jgi:uncharacterized membrane protein YcaP (DUF421 family)
MTGFEAVLGHGTPMQIAWWQMCIRAVIVFFFGVILLRIAGKRAFGQQSALDIVLAVLIGSNLSRAPTGGSPFAPTLAASAVTTLLYYVSIHLTERQGALGWMLKGRPVVLVRDGSPDPKALFQAGVSHADLEEAIRSKGVERFADVARATLERSGHISVIKRKA